MNIQNSSLNFLLKSQVTLSVLALIILVTHYKALSVFYVQDDAYAWINGAHWFQFYGTIDTALQYRPNSWLITYLLDQIAPDRAWPLRVMGMIILWVTATALYFLVRALSANNVLATVAGILVCVHPAFYSYMTLYLSAVMTGLGVICVLFGALSALHAADRGRTSDIMLTLIWLVLALTSYEAAIIILPIMIGIDYLYSQNRRVLTTLRRYLPHIFITFSYLFFRSFALETHSQIDSDNRYLPQLDQIIVNLPHIWNSFVGLDIVDQSPATLYLAWILGCLAAIGGSLYAVLNKKMRLWLGAVFWVILGAIPFLFVSGFSLHYSVYAVIGFIVLLAMSICIMEKYHQYVATILLVIITGLGVASNQIAYDKNILTSMANTGKNIVEQFKSFGFDNRNIILMNMNNHLAWRIHFGSSINVSFRDNPYVIEIPQGNWRVKIDGDPHSVIFVENFVGDHPDVKTRLHDVTAHYDPSAPEEIVLMEQYDDKNAYFWAPSGAADHGALTIQAPVDAVMTAQIGGILCTVSGNKNAMAFPPRSWAEDDRIVVIAKAEQPSLRIKQGINLPDGDYAQRCSKSMFDTQ